MEPMMDRPCPRCGDQRLEVGRLNSQHTLVFRPDRIGFFTFRSTVPIVATMCRSCGHIEMSGDLQRLQRILEQ